jgi:hypothetical protein
VHSKWWIRSPVCGFGYIHLLPIRAVLFGGKSRSGFRNTMSLPSCTAIHLYRCTAYAPSSIFRCNMHIFSSRFFPSFWKFSPLSYGGMKFRGFCSPSAFENGGSSPDCRSETHFLHSGAWIGMSSRSGSPLSGVFEAGPSLQWELLALKLVGRLSRESLKTNLCTAEASNAHSSSSIFWWNIRRPRDWSWMPCIFL